MYIFITLEAEYLVPSKIIFYTTSTNTKLKDIKIHSSDFLFDSCFGKICDTSTEKLNNFQLKRS